MNLRFLLQRPYNVQIHLRALRYQSACLREPAHNHPNLDRLNKKAMYHLKRIEAGTLFKFQTGHIEPHSNCFIWSPALGAATVPARVCAVVLVIQRSTKGVSA